MSITGWCEDISEKEATATNIRRLDKLCKKLYLHLHSKGFKELFKPKAKIVEYNKNVSKFED